MEKEEYYSHWFWNSWFMNMVADFVLKLDAYIFAKQHERD